MPLTGGQLALFRLVILSIRDEAARQRTERLTLIADAAAQRRNVHDVYDDVQLDEGLTTAALGTDIASVTAREAQKALQRIATDAYGVCCDCLKDIPYARLVAQPLALRCVECQESFELRI